LEKCKKGAACCIVDSRKKGTGFTLRPKGGGGKKKEGKHQGRKKEKGAIPRAERGGEKEGKTSDKKGTKTS